MHAEAPVAGSLSILVPGPLNLGLWVGLWVGLWGREPKLVFLGGGRGGRGGEQSITF
jgi:hypothetical protein